MSSNGLHGFESHRFLQNKELGVQDVKQQLEGIAAQLRHAYAQLAAGTVVRQQEFAEGLISPQIKRLERLAGRL